MSFDLLKEFGGLDGEPRSRFEDRHGGGSIDVEEQFGEFEEPQTQEQSSGHENTSAKAFDLHSGGHANPFLQGLKAHKGLSDTPRRQPGLQKEVLEDHCNKLEEESGLFDDADSVLPRCKPATRKRLIEKAPSSTPQLEVDGLFDTWEPEDSSQIAASPRTIHTEAATPTAHITPTCSPQRVKSAKLGPPPANIPPPSILLSLSAHLLSTIPSKIKNTLTGNYEYLDQPRVDQLLHQISVFYAIARVAAGRKLRWKRDNLLSQSMKIGPAGKQGGMKLTGIDKAESRREDQEAAEVVGSWKQQVGPLRSMLVMVNVHLKDRGLALPEIAESMPVRAGRHVEGAVAAPKACFLCGLKRDERVLKVDENVQDSFGEWWTEHWGHVDCVKFWHDHKEYLAQR